MRPLITTTLLALAALVAFPPSSAAAAGWTWPVRGEVITPYRNGDDPYAAGQHRGIDIAAPEGAAVEAAAAGSVTFAGRAGQSGLTVNVRTADGRFDLSYLHLASVVARAGDRVEAGRRIGAVGTTGTRSTQQPHLHFGVRDAGSRHAYRNPLDFLPPPGRPGPAPEPPPLPVEVPLVPLTPLPLPAPSEAPRALPPPSAEPRPAPAPGEAPRGVPAPGDAPVTDPWGAADRIPAPLRGPRPAPVSAPLPSGARDGGPRPAPVSTRSFRPFRSAVAFPAHSPAQLARVGPPAKGPSTGAPPPAGGERAGASPPRDGAAKRGINLGWLAACAGLVMAALALGRPAGPMTAARRARATISAAARPLSGRS